MVRCDISTTQNDDGTIKCEGKKKREPPNVTNEQLHVIFELHNLKIELSNVKIKKIKKNNHQMWQKYCQMWEKK